ncbi:putative ribonuclease H-like domain-containing protein [Tanacetum coccineum]
MKSGLKILNTARKNSLKAAVSVNTARPINTAYLRPTVNSAKTTSNVFNRAHSHVRWPFNKSTTNKNSNLNKKVNTISRNVTTVEPKAVVSNNKGNEANVVKASACRSKSVMAWAHDWKQSYSQIIVEKLLVGFVAPMDGIKGGKITGKGSLTCLFAKATLDESNLWHRRLGHINFKTINKLVRGNLVRGLPSKIFENNHTCVACQKGKQHKASCIENLIDLKVKVIRCDNGTEFKNKVMNQFCEIKGSGPEWLFDIDTLKKSMNYKPVVAGNQTSGSQGTKESIDAGQARKKTVSSQEYILLPLLTYDPSLSKGSKDSPDAGCKPSRKKENTNNISTASDRNNTNNANTVSSTINVTGIEDNAAYENIVYGCDDDPNMPNLEEIAYSDDDEDVGVEADMNNLNTFMPVSPIPTTRLHKDHPLEQIIGDIHSAPQTRRMTKSVTEHEPKKVIQELQDPIWIKAMQEELLNKARFVAQGYTQEEGLDYDEMDVKSAFLYGKIEEEVYVCQPPGFEDPEFPDRRGTIDKTLFIKKVNGDILQVQVYVDDIIFGSTKKGLCTEFEKLMHKKFKMSSIGELTFFLGLQVTQKYDRIFISQDKYMDKILKKFGFSTVKTASTPMETSKPLMKDDNAEDVDIHLYRSMIGSLMYLTYSRPDIMFAVCACARFQVTPKVSHLHVVKRIFRYLKGQPKLGLWYPKDSPFDLEAYTNSDYAGASLDRKSTTRDCQFLGRRLISWQCKKQTVVSNSTTEAEYVAASSCRGQVLWIQNQLLDYGYNFMNTKIFIDNESTICIVKNPVFHSKTKHIEIRHHFIRDSYEKRLIQVIKIHTDHNVADLLTKAFDIDDWNGLEMLRMKLGLKLCCQTKVNAARLLTTARPMVAYMEKSTEHADFDEIVDFLNASPIRYALTVSPTIYVSYIEQFWSTAKIKIVNNERQIRAKVNGKTIVILESSVRRDLQFNDEDGTVTPLFATKLIQPQADVGEGSGQPTKPQHTPTTASPSNIEPIPLIASSSQPQMTYKHETVDSIERAATTIASLDAEQDSDNIITTQSMTTLNEPIPQRTGSETHGRYDQDIDVTTASAPVTTTGVSVSTAEPSTPPTTTIVIVDEDLTIAQTLMKMRSEKSKDKAKERGSRTEKIRRQPPTKAKKRNQMSTYLRNMAGYKHTQLKNKSFEEIQMLFDKEMKRVNSFVPMDSEVVEGSGKKTESNRKLKGKIYKKFSAMLDDFDKHDLGTIQAGKGKNMRQQAQKDMTDYFGESLKPYLSQVRKMISGKAHQDYTLIS